MLQREFALAKEAWGTEREEQRSMIEELRRGAELAAEPEALRK